MLSIDPLDLRYWLIIPGGAKLHGVKGAIKIGPYDYHEIGDIIQDFPEEVRPNLILTTELIRPDDRLIDAIGRGGKQRYVVIGGEFESTACSHLVSPMVLKGPFDTYEEAYNAWRAETFLKVDNCHFRLFIWPHDDEAVVQWVNEHKPVDTANPTV